MDGNGILKTAKIGFRGVGDLDVYNITAPIFWRGQWLLAGRVERRATENSTTVFFTRARDGAWETLPSAPTFVGLQDPCIAVVDDELVLGGVEFPYLLQNGETSYRMRFYRGPTPQRLSHFLDGPDGMKDIRLARLPNDAVCVFSRPQGEKGGRGKIGFTQVPSLDDLTADVIEMAPLLPNQFLDAEWGGANEIHVLRNGWLGVLGHIACFDEHSHRHYYPMVFSLNPRNGETRRMKIIAERRHFPAGAAKRPDLADVVFSGGLVRHWDGTATLFAGIGDTEAAYLQLPDPFLDYES